MLERYLFKPGATIRNINAQISRAPNLLGSDREVTVDIRPGLYNGRHKYLPFVQDRINYTTAGNEDVLSFDFSGCLMASYKIGGERRVCHVSTGGPGNCLSAWRALAKNATEVYAFKPDDFLDERLAAGAAFEGAKFGCWGLITADLRTFAITASYKRDQILKVSVARARLWSG